MFCTLPHNYSPLLTSLCGSIKWLGSSVPGRAFKSRSDLKVRQIEGKKSNIYIL